MESKIMENHRKGIIIPYDRLSMEALQGFIEEFVSRDGTDTGYTDGEVLEKMSKWSCGSWSVGM
jgi:hypothetical protein